MGRMCRDIENPFLKKLQSEVHVWFCRPEDINDQNRLASYRELLSAHEKDRLDRFRFQNDRHNYLVSHAMLRLVLEKYLAVGGAELEFVYNDHGKPGLAHHVLLPAVEFNLTHTDGLCACVVVLGASCGIDAENIHRKNNLTAVAQRMFSDKELDVLLASDRMSDHFYDYWTLREAYVKALGTGLSGSSKDFYFSVSGELSDGMSEQSACPPRSATIHHGTGVGGLKDWYFRLISPTPKHRMAVAYQATGLMDVLVDEVAL